MLRILFLDGKEMFCEGKVKFYEREYEALCCYDLNIEGRDEHDYSNLKLVYDEETQESVYFDTLSYGFYKGEEKYKELYTQSLRDLKLIEKFKKYFELFVVNRDFNDIDELAGIITRQEKEIMEIYQTT